MSAINRLTAMASVRRESDYVESRVERESRRWLSCSVSSGAADPSERVGWGEEKSAGDRYLVVRKVSVRLKRESGDEWERETGGRFKGSEMGRGLKVER